MIICYFNIISMFVTPLSVDSYRRHNLRFLYNAQAETDSNRFSDKTICVCFKPGRFTADSESAVYAGGQYSLLILATNAHESVHEKRSRILNHENTKFMKSTKFFFVFFVSFALSWFMFAHFILFS